MNYNYNYNYTLFVQRQTYAIKSNLGTNMQDITIKRSCMLLTVFDEYLQNEAITNWVNEFNLVPKVLYSYLKGDEKPDLSASEELKEYLQTFDIWQNEITGEQIIKKENETITRDELELRLESENCDIRHLKKYLNIENKHISVVKTFNPLRDLMYQLADNYKGEQLIKELAACIPATDFKDKKEGFYQDRVEYYLRKWMSKAVGQLFGFGKNDAMLLWIDPIGGTGKSYINQWLFSLPELANYYIPIQENASFMPLSVISKGKFIIDWDELTLSLKRYQMFKSYIASKHVHIYSKKNKNYGRFDSQINYIGSTNKGNRNGNRGFLLDDDDAMKRRIIPIDIDADIRIDYERYLKIDLYQLWGEAAAGVLRAKKTNNKQLLTWECDWEDLKEQNRRYVNNSEQRDKSTLLKVIKPADKGTGVLLSSSEILNELNKKGIKHNLTPEKVGRFLKKHGYIDGRKKNYRGYYVKAN